MWKLWYDTNSTEVHRGGKTVDSPVTLNTVSDLSSIIFLLNTADHFIYDIMKLCDRSLCSSVVGQWYPGEQVVVQVQLIYNSFHSLSQWLWTLRWPHVHPNDTRTANILCSVNFLTAVNENTQVLCINTHLRYTERDYVCFHRVMLTDFFIWTMAILSVIETRCNSVSDVLACGQASLSAGNSTPFKIAFHFSINSQGQV